MSICPPGHEPGGRGDLPGKGRGLRPGPHRPGTPQPPETRAPRRSDRCAGRPRTWSRRPSRPARSATAGSPKLPLRSVVESKRPCVPRTSPARHSRSSSRSETTPPTLSPRRTSSTSIASPRRSLGSPRQGGEQPRDRFHVQCSRPERRPARGRDPSHRVGKRRQDQALPPHPPQQRGDGPTRQGCSYGCQAASSRLFAVSRAV